MGVDDEIATSWPGRPPPGAPAAYPTAGWCRRRLRVKLDQSVHDAAEQVLHHRAPDRHRVAVPDGNRRRASRWRSRSARRRRSRTASAPSASSARPCVAGEVTSARRVPLVNVDRHVRASDLATRCPTPPATTSSIRAARPGSARVADRRSLWHSSVWRNCRLRTKSMYCSRCSRSGLIRSSVAATDAGKCDVSISLDDCLGQILQAHALRALDELVEVHRQVRPLEVFVKQYESGERPSRSASPVSNWWYGPVPSEADARNFRSARACSTCSLQARRIARRDTASCGGPSHACASRDRCCS